MPLTVADNRDLIRTRAILDQFAGAVGLPPVIADALELLDRVRSVSPPAVGNAAADARRDARDRIAAAVHAGKTPTVQDIAAVTEAADGEQRARLLADLVDEVTVDTVHDVLATISASADDLIRHAADGLAPSFATLTDHAGDIPPGYTDAQAFRDPHRADVWREVSDAADRIIGLHHARSQLRNLAIIAKPRIDPADHFALIRNPYDVTPLLITGVKVHPSRTLPSPAGLPDAPVDRLLEQARRGADFWFPTTGEQDAHAREVLTELARPEGFTPRVRGSDRTLSTA